MGDITNDEEIIYQDEEDYDGAVVEVYQEESDYNEDYDADEIIYGVPSGSNIITSVDIDEFQTALIEGTSNNPDDNEYINIERDRLNNGHIKLKADFIDSILLLYDRLNIPIEEQFTESQLKRVKKVELKQLLADLMNTGYNISTGFQPVVECDIQPEQYDTEYIAIQDDRSEDVAVQALFSINCMLVKVCESLSIRYEEKLGGNLEGWTRQVVDTDREAITEALRAVYREHKSSIEQYLSPMVNYGMIMMFSGLNAYKPTSVQE